MPDVVRRSSIFRRSGDRTLNLEHQKRTLYSANPTWTCAVLNHTENVLTTRMQSVEFGKHVNPMSNSHFIECSQYIIYKDKMGFSCFQYIGSLCDKKSISEYNSPSRSVCVCSAGTGLYKVPEVLCNCLSVKNQSGTTWKHIYFNEWFS